MQGKTDLCPPAQPSEREMSLFTGGKRKKPRGFDYEPRYYDPEEDEEKQRSERVKKRMRIKSKTRRGKSTSLLYLLALLGFTVYLYLVL